jgi:hypothetical protein
VRIELRATSAVTAERCHDAKQRNLAEDYVNSICGWKHAEAHCSPSRPIAVARLKLGGGLRYNEPQQDA